MQEILNLESKEQMELLGDPFCLDIIGVMEQKIVTADWITEKLGTDAVMVQEYLNKMEKLGFVVIIDSENKTKYQITAESFEAKDVIFQCSSRESKDWIMGFINHLQNQLLDLFNFIHNKEDIQGFLKDCGYNDYPLTSQSRVYMTDKEAEEFIKTIMKFIKEKSTPERKAGEEYRPYDMFQFLFPNLQYLKEE